MYPVLLSVCLYEVRRLAQGVLQRRERPETDWRQGRVHIWRLQGEIRLPSVRLTGVFMAVDVLRHRRQI